MWRPEVAVEGLLIREALFPWTTASHFVAVWHCFAVFLQSGLSHPGEKQCLCRTKLECWGAVGSMSEHHRRQCFSLWIFVSWTGKWSHIKWGDLVPINFRPITYLSISHSFSITCYLIITMQQLERNALLRHCNYHLKLHCIFFTPLPLLAFLRNPLNRP